MWARYTTLLRAVELWGAVQADGPGRLAGDEEPPAVDGFVVGREENFSQQIKADPEDRLSTAFVGLEEDGPVFRLPFTGRVGERKSHGQHSQKLADPVGVNEVGVLEIEAPRLGGRKKRFDRPPPPVMGQGDLGIGVGGDYKQVSADQPRRSQFQCRSKRAVAGSKPAVLADVTSPAHADFPKQGSHLALTSVREADVEGVLDAQDERDVPLRKRPHPGRADELPISNQSDDGGLAKDGAEAGQKGAPLSRGGGPGSVKNVPHHRNGNAVMDDRQHQDIDVVAAKLPTRAVEGQKPRPRSKTCDPNDHTGELASVYDDLCEEALETAVVRGDRGPRGKHAGNMAQIDGAG